MNIRRARTPCSRTIQRGYTLLEILVALFIGVFLLAGLFTILQNTRRTSSNQTGLAQLQDQQRMAMSILTDVIQNAGYFDAATTSASVALPTVSGFVNSITMAGSQGIAGFDAAAGDTIIARYATNGTDGLINCFGATGPLGTFVNVFYIQTVPNSATTTYALYCSTDGTSLSGGIPLVTGVQNMQIYYGVATVTGATNVDTYMTAAQVQAAGDWAKVSSVRVTLSFVNPLAGQAGYSSTNNIYLTRVIPLQSRTGVTSAL